MLLTLLASSACTDAPFASIPEGHDFAVAGGHEGQVAAECVISVAASGTETGIGARAEAQNTRGAWLHYVSGRDTGQDSDIDPAVEALYGARYEDARDAEAALWRTLAVAGYQHRGNRASG